MKERKEFFIGDLVRFKNDGSYGIIEYSYKDAFIVGTHNEFCIKILNEKGVPINTRAWIDKSELECVDTTHRESNLEKIKEYNKGHGAPISMDPELAEILGYGFVYTYETARI